MLKYQTAFSSTNQTDRLIIYTWHRKNIMNPVPTVTFLLSQKVFRFICI